LISWYNNINLTPTVLWLFSPLSKTGLRPVAFLLFGNFSLNTKIREPASSNSIWLLFINLLWQNSPSFNFNHLFHHFVHFLVHLLNSYSLLFLTSLFWEQVFLLFHIHVYNGGKDIEFCYIKQTFFLLKKLVVCLWLAKFKNSIVGNVIRTGRKEHLDVEHFHYLWGLW